MCGIAGFWAPHGDVNKSQAQSWLSLMIDSIAHRGPDGEGIWCDVSAGIGLGHRRLAVLDLSSAGHQPMVSACGRYVIVFNGEIYNHLDLRRELESSQFSSLPNPLIGARITGWRGHADTETLIAAFSYWGIRETLTRAVGMFALAVWDRENRTLTLARDRLGEKPLYYGWQKGVLLFGSELKALRAHPSFDDEIDRNALLLFMRHGTIHAPHSIYRGILKLPPGTFLTIRQGFRDSAPEPYWSAFEAVAHGQRIPFMGSAQDAADELERLLDHAIAGQMLADVPLGAFLSGGVDSSVVVALMQKQSSRPVKTFSIGFQEDGYNEAIHARAIAQNLGTDHTELYVTPREAQAVIPQLPGLYDEPFADSSQIPTYLVAQLARRHVTVSLSGDGGDELFGGYNTYALANQIWCSVGHFPHLMRLLLAVGITRFCPSTWNSLFCNIRKMLPTRYRYTNSGDKLYKLAEVLRAKDRNAFYRMLVSSWKQPAKVVIGGQEPPSVLADEANWPHLPDFEQHMMYLDLVSYLPDDILVKVDRAAMGVSLETRIPLLDHRIVEFAWSLPLNYKLREGQTKWPLRQVLYRHVPQELIERPKMGFGIPLHEWLCGPLRDWVENLLDETRLQHEGFFNVAPIRRIWMEHLSGTRNWTNRLWSLLMFQAWLENGYENHDFGRHF